MWSLNGLRPKEVLRRTVRGIRMNALDARSAQCAYYGMLLIPPTLIVLVTVAAHLPVDGLLERLESGAEQALPAGAYDVLDHQIQDLRAKRSSGLLWFSLGVFVISGCKLFITVGRGLNAAFGTRESRPFWKVWGLSFLVGFGAFLLLMVSAATLLIGPAIHEHVLDGKDIPVLSLLWSDGARVIVVCVSALLATSLIYRIVPDVSQRWNPLTPGSVLAVAAWIGLTLGFKAYVDNFARYNEIYGALAGVIVLMIWLYLSAMTFFLGGQLNAVIMSGASLPTGNPEEREP